MDKQQAQKIIKDTFERSFDMDRFTVFIKNLLNRIDESKAFHAHGYVKEGFRGIIKTYERVGTYNAPDDKKVDIIVVYLQKGSSLDHARVTQRNFAGRYLDDRGEKDAGLFAFVSPDEEDWRFSLVKLDYKFEQSTSGKMKVKEEFTPARRWSFLVGKNEKSHTAQSRLVNILADDEHPPTLKEIEKAFDIETVTREFFLKYRELFLRTKEELDRVVKKDPKVKADFESKGVDTVNFAKKLLGQIVFLYFLQKKGWFGVERDADWGDGSKHFLRELFDKKHGDYKNFFNDILEPLFYEALRIDRSHDDGYYSRFDCKIPFLNGGLFDPIGGYDWVKTVINIPDKLFSNKSKHKEGDGILDIFDLYNFTVKEDEPLEKEVAIDPELLGKAYEKFNAIRPDNYAEFRKALKSGKTGEENKFNKKFGVYYTPREIVHYMCQQSLINYLDTAVNTHKEPIITKPAVQKKIFGHQSPVQQILTSDSYKPIIPKKDIEKLIQTGEQVSENEARVLSKGKETKTYSHQLPESIRKNAKLIDDKLAEITVCDPAVGSGAFPVGMMSEIVKTRNVLTSFLSLRGTQATKQSQFDDNRTVYNFKRRCIEHSLYGVDIDPGAVEIAKLRLWLSLVVDEEDIKNIKPLPNLDYKIVCGNSLLGVEKDLFNFQLFNELEELKPLFFNETNPTKKQEYKKQIDKLISEITNGHKEFDFEVYFSEVFHKKGGFDVVIANPPYIFARESHSKGLTKELKTKLYKKYQLAKYQLNSYPLFIELSDNILRENGILSFIVPNNWMTINNNKDLREFILRKSDIILVNFYAKVFESANVDSSVVIFRKSRKNKKIKLFEYEERLKLIKALQSDYFLSQDDFIINIELFKNDITRDLLEKIKKQSSMLKNIADVKAGLKAYEIGKGKPAQTRNMKEKRIYHSKRKIDGTYFIYLDGKDVNRYYLKWSGEYLKYGENLAAPRNSFNLFSTKRILVRQIPSKPPYCINACLTTEIYLNDLNSMNVINIKIEPEYVLAILNSKLISFWFMYKFGKLQRGIFPQFKINELKLFPIKEISATSQEPFVNLVKRILSITKSEGYLENNQKQAKVKALEAEIDQLVYKLYDLTPEEIKIVERQNRDRGIL